MIEFVSDLRQVGIFLQVFGFLLKQNLNAMIYLKPAPNTITLTLIQISEHKVYNRLGLLVQQFYARTFCFCKWIKMCENTNVPLL